MTSKEATINFRISPLHPSHKFAIFDCLPTVLTIDNLHCEETGRIGGKGSTKKAKYKYRHRHTFTRKYTPLCHKSSFYVRGGDKK